MKEWLLQRLSEPSTIQGMILLWTAAGITIHPEKTNDILTAGLAILGAAKILTVENTKPL